MDVIVVAKILLQELWQLGLGWDETILLALHAKWSQFKEELEHINRHKTTRNNQLS